MVGQNFLLILAVVALVGASITPPTRNQVSSVNGKMADPANRRATGVIGGTDPRRINGVDSALLLVPSKDGTMAANFQVGTETIEVVIRYPTAGTYQLGLAPPNTDCQAAGFDGTVQATTQDSIANNGIVSTIVFKIPTSSTADVDGGALLFWNARVIDRELSSRKICIRDLPTTFTKWTGATLRSVFDCAASGGCSQFALTNILELNQNLQQAIDKSVRTVCCTPQASGVVPAAWRIGTCINPNVHQCCGGSVAGPSIEAVAGVPVPVFSKCCSNTTELLVDDVTPCPCRASQATPTPAGDIVGVNTDCPLAGSRCCLPDPARYPELTTTLSATERVVIGDVWGSCYDTTTSYWKCCTTGQLYNEGSHRCCTIGGVQPRDVPCSCSTDSHCGSTGRCCTATNPDRPIPNEADRCNVYQAYPYNPANLAIRNFGQNPSPSRTDMQLCYGYCINPDFQTCCNGVVCVRAYEKCCNSTCCNKFSQTCIDGTRTVSSQYNTNSFRTQFYTCSTIELLTVLKAGMIYIIPLALLIATFTGLGIVLVFANKASNRSYSFIETAMIVLALASAFTSIPLFFSPMFKYAVFIIFAALFSILSAAARVKIVNVFAIVTQIVILFYIFDPIHGNRYLTFTSFPNLVGPNAGRPDTETKGLLHTTTSMFYRNGVVDTSFCTTFYDYFDLEPMARDTARFDNPDIKTFGYCKRGWVAFLLIFEGLLIVSFVLLFVVSLISLLLRFRKAVNLAPITLEILKEEELPFNPVPLY